MAERIEYELTRAEDEVLMSVTEAAYANAGAFGGAIGGGLAGGGTAGASGGAKGGRRGAKRTKPHSAADSAEVELTVAEAEARVRAAMEDKGAVIEDPNAAGDGSVWGVVASGTMDMAPALVRVGIEPSAVGSRVEVRATGREALIKQKIARKAAERIVAALTAG